MDMDRISKPQNGLPVGSQTPPVQQGGGPFFKALYPKTVRAVICAAHHVLFPSPLPEDWQPRSPLEPGSLSNPRTV